MYVCFPLCIVHHFALFGEGVEPITSRLYAIGSAAIDGATGVWYTCAMPGLLTIPSQLTLDDVRRALLQPRPGATAQAIMWPRRLPGNEPPPTNQHGRDAAVLILVYLIDADPYLVLTRRVETVQNHKGQISLPGGAHEGEETLVETALREAREEIAVSPGDVQVLGTLTPVYVSVSGYLVTPFVAITAQRPTFRPDPSEVVEAIEAPLNSLLDPALRHEEDWQIRGATVHVPYFAIGSHKVWGATAMILAEFASLLEAACQCRVQ